MVSHDDDFDQWYVDVVQMAELADDAPVRGCKVIRPYGYGLWEQMVARLDARIKATGVDNAYFPLFIPQGMLTREADPVRDRQALERLADWCGRFTPWVGVDPAVGPGEAGLFLDVTGCAHLRV